MDLNSMLESFGFPIKRGKGKEEEEEEEENFYEDLYKELGCFESSTVSVFHIIILLLFF
jgi:hypothetical protein